MRKQIAKPRKRRKRKPKHIYGPPVQLHHDEYDPDSGEVLGVTVGHLFKGEHSIITALRRQTRNVSLWFIECLQRWTEDAAEHVGFRDLNQEIEDLPEGKSFHCKWCGKGFLVKKNRGIHEQKCFQKGSDN